MRRLTQIVTRSLTFKVLTLVALTALFAVLVQPASVADAQLAAVARSAGFGAAFGYAQRIGPVAFTSAGSIGTGFGAALAVSPASFAASLAASAGPAAAFAQSVGTPFGSSAWVQTAAFFGGAAFGAAAAGP